MHTSSRSKALQALHGESGFSRRSSRTKWAALLASCQIWGISSVLNNPLPPDTSCTLFPPFLFSLIHPIKKYVTRTRYEHRYGHSSSPACATYPGLGNRSRNSHLPPTGKRGRATILQQRLREKDPSTTMEMRQHLPLPMHTQQMNASNTWLPAWPQIFSVSSCMSLVFFMPLKHK